MQKKTQGWEPNTERLFARDGVLIGNNFMALKLEGGGHYLHRRTGTMRLGGAAPCLPEKITQCPIA